MAIFNEILVARYPRFIQKLFSMKGPQSTPQVSGEVIPVVPMFNGVENRSLEGWNRWFQGVNLVAPGAGNFNVQRFAAHPSVVAVIEKITFTAAAAALNYNVLYFQGTRGGQIADLVNPAVTVNNSFDNRPGLTSPTLTVSSSSGATQSTGLLVAILNCPANSIIDFILFEDQEITLPPGSALDIQTGVANTPMQATVVWRERAIEESERNP